MAAKKVTNPSRRNFLFGGLRKARERLDEVRKEPPVMPSMPTEGVSKDVATRAKEAFVAANEAYADADYGSAVPKYRKCIKLVPAHMEARKRMGYCLYRMGQYLQAKIEFERVLRELKKDNFSSLYLGLTFAQLGKTDKVAEALKGYFNPKEVRIMRELNVQIAMLESPEPPSMEYVIAGVEEAILARKEELLQDQG